MKKIPLIFSILVLVAPVFLSSCDDDEESKSKTQLLTAKTWTVSKVEISYSGTTLDVSDDWITDCQKDNTVKFNSNGTYDEKTGTDNCNGDEADASGTWSLVSNQTVLKINIAGDLQEWKIVSISENSVILRMEAFNYDSDGDGTGDTEVDLIFTMTGK